MAQSQPFGVSARGGLNTNLNQLEMLSQPGFATRLTNFEVDADGGYRRINGYVPFGGDDAVSPTGGTVSPITGVHVYGDGVIATAANDIYFSNDGITWIQLNKASVASGGDNYSTFNSRSELTLSDCGVYEFSTYEGITDHGEVFMTDKSGNNKPFWFKMTGTGDLDTRTFYAAQLTISSSTAAKFNTLHDGHFVAAGDPTTPDVIYYSGTNDPTDFSSSGSGSIRLEDKIVGMKTFRDDMIIFCENSLFKLANINNSSTIDVTPITKNVGCMDGRSIQEIGGDLVFLSPDGIRTVAGTARIGDVELGSVSRQIQSVISGIAAEIDNVIISSGVIRNKSQYRLFYAAAGQSQSSSKGIIGTFTPNGFEWSETEGIQAHGYATSFDSDGIEKAFHGDSTGFVYVHNSGNFFSNKLVATNIIAHYNTPDFDMGDAGTRKTMQYVKISFTPEGQVDPLLRVRYDYEDINQPQPDQYSLSQIPAPAVFGSSEFNDATFGGLSDPLVRQAIQGSGHTVSFKISSNDQNPPYAVNGFYVDYVPAGRR